MLIQAQAPTIALLGIRKNGDPLSPLARRSAISSVRELTNAWGIQPIVFPPRRIAAHHPVFSRLTTRSISFLRKESWSSSAARKSYKHKTENSSWSEPALVGVVRDVPVLKRVDSEDGEAESGEMTSSETYGEESM